MEFGGTYLYELCVPGLHGGKTPGSTLDGGDWRLLAKYATHFMGLGRGVKIAMVTLSTVVRQDESPSTVHGSSTLPAMIRRSTSRLSDVDVVEVKTP
jgi:hypothetical protein